MFYMYGRLAGALHRQNHEKCQEDRKRIKFARNGILDFTIASNRISKLEFTPAKKGLFSKMGLVVKGLTDHSWILEDLFLRSNAFGPEPKKKNNIYFVSYYFRD